MSDLREDERAFLAVDRRCEHCQHLSALHWDTDEDSGCSLPDCECTGMSVDMTGWAPPDPNDPMPRVWGEEIRAAAASTSVLSRLVDRSFEPTLKMGPVINITGHRYMPLTIIDDPVGG